MNLETLFQKWLEDNTNLKAKSITSYIGGIKTMWRDLKNKGIEVPDFYEISSVSEISKYRKLFNSFEDLADRDNRGNGMYRNSWNHYIDFLSTLNTEDNLADDLNEINENSKTTKTQKQILTEARIGQGKYKKELVELWKCCSLSGYSNSSLLIGSHIKPWSRCENDFEKLDKFNGLLLSPNLDKLFDNGLISFKNNGHVIVSNNLAQKDLDYFNISFDSQIEFFSENLKYLKFHREYVFKN